MRKGAIKQTKETLSGCNHQHKLCLESPFLSNGCYITCHYAPTFSFTRCLCLLQFLFFIYFLILRKFFLLVAQFDEQCGPTTTNSPEAGPTADPPPYEYLTMENCIHHIGTNSEASDIPACQKTATLTIVGVLMYFGIYYVRGAEK